MARYYFHLMGVSKWQVSDAEDFADDAAAIENGRGVARELAANRRESEFVRNGMLRVTDEEGIEILAVRLSHAYEAVP